MSASRNYFCELPLTTVVHSHKAQGRWPDPNQNNGRPAIVEGGNTSSNLKYVISAWLNDVMDCHCVDGKSNA